MSPKCVTLHALLLAFVLGLPARGAKRCRDASAALRPGAPRDTVIFGYWPPGAKTSNASAAQYWRKQFGIDFQNASSDTSTVHLSQKDLVVDAILGLTHPGENIRVLGLEPAFADGGRLLQRNLASDHPSLLIVTETALKSRGPDPERALDELIAEAGAGVPVLVLREASESHWTSLSSQHPLILESLHFESGLTTPLSLTAGHPELIARLNQAMSRRNAWIPDRYLRELNDVLDRSPRSQVPNKPFDVSGTANLGGMPAFLSEHTLVKTLLDLKDFIGRDPKTTLDLGVGQPHIELAGRMRLPNLRPGENVREEAESGVREWYREQYDADLKDAALTFTAGSSAAIEQVLTQIPEGSTILIPDYSYSGIERTAQLQGLKVKIYSPTDDSLLHLPLDPSVKLVVTNFPHNPSGRLMTDKIRAELQRIAANGTVVFNDLSYTRIAYDGNAVTSLFSGVKSPKNLVEAFSGSKDIGLTESRVSALVGDPEFIGHVRTSPLSDENDISPKRLQSLVEVLKNPAMFVTGQAEMQKRRDGVVAALRGIGWPRELIQVPEGGLNVMIDLPPGIDPRDVTTLLWKEAKVFIAPDDWFGARSNGSRFLRISLSESSERIEGLAARLKSAGIEYHDLPRKIFQSAARESVKSHGLAWQSNKFKPGPVSPAAAEKLLQRLERNPELLAEVEAHTRNLGGVTNPALWDQYMEVYDKLVLFDPHYEKLVERVNEEVAKDGLVYDVGAGSGNFSLRLALGSSNRKVVGADISPHGLDFAKQKQDKVTSLSGSDRLRFEVLDGKTIPAKQVDSAVVINTFYTVPDKLTFLRELRESLAPDGTIHLHDFFPEGKNISVPEGVLRDRFSSEIKDAVSRGAQLTEQEIAFLYFMNRERILHTAKGLTTRTELETLLGQAGLKIESEEPSGYLGGTLLRLRAGR